MRPILFLVFAMGAATAAFCAAGRAIVSLDGEWRIDESVDADAVPKEFKHRVPVPGLAKLAEPAFADVDKFDSRELIEVMIVARKLPESARVTTAGTPHQPRNYFWYTRTFRAPARREVALLRVNKAQFGTAVWVNGQSVGEHAGCFTAATFDVSSVIRWGATNTVVIRVGAHPAAMPVEVPAGTDKEKTLWTAGIYDSVSLVAGDNPMIESVQVAPRVEPREVTVQAVLRNYGTQPRKGELNLQVREWKSGREVAKAAPASYDIGTGASQTITVRIPVANARLWTLDDPFLHTATAATNGDEVTARFGVREFRSDTATGRFHLNNRPVYLRGSNITLHRFFEDADCGARPWDEAWVRKLLVEIPRRMGWNSFRFCIGPVPDRWLDIADEAGLLIQQEYFIWTGPKPQAFHAEWTNDSLTRELSEFVRDNCNHPSVAIWDACNETRAARLAGIINQVRPMDLSNRPWENGYNDPAGPDDPVESHPYEDWKNGGEYLTGKREQMQGDKLGGATPKTNHPAFVNEYGWAWLNRDGTPTLLTQNLYDSMLGKDATPEQRFEFNGYYLGALTEFWRAHRKMAGVLHFVYLTSSYPGAYTADHFRDVRSLELEPHFADYVVQAFKPLGVYVNLWRPKLTAGSTEQLVVMLVNDHDRQLRGTVELILETAAGREVLRQKADLALAPLGDQKMKFEVSLPRELGSYRLRAVARPTDGGETVSRRRFQLVSPEEVKPAETAAGS